MIDGDRSLSIPLVTLPAAIAIVGALTVATVWTLQARGYAPCDVCLEERVPYYVATPLAAALAALSRWLPRSASRYVFALIAASFAVGTALGIYHLGLEAHLWPGPADCSGAIASPKDVGSFLKQLDNVAVVRCDEVAVTVFGLSLAAWNAVVSTTLLAAAVAGWRMSR